MRQETCVSNGNRNISWETTIRFYRRNLVHRFNTMQIVPIFTHNAIKAKDYRSLDAPSKHVVRFTQFLHRLLSSTTHSMKREPFRTRCWAHPYSTMECKLFETVSSNYIFRVPIPTGFFLIRIVKYSYFATCFDTQRQHKISMQKRRYFCVFVVW